MDSYQSPTFESLRPPSNTSNNNLFSNKNTIIILLCVLLLFSFLGINILNIFGNLIQMFARIFGPLVAEILSLFGYTAGSAINASTEVVADVSKTGIDIAADSVQHVGTLLKNVSQTNVNDSTKNALDQTLNLGNLNKPLQPSDDNSESPIQKPITSGKQSWCLVGEYQGKRGCIEIDKHDKCLSGQVFPSQKMCLNPTLTPNVPPNNNSNQARPFNA